ncbi:MAG: protein kinase [Deltaproteobacteria bacterium]|jgi:serine/threonine protein kinase
MTTYRKIRRLGGGGMGEVFLARQESEAFERLVALKYMRVPPGADLEEFERMFRNEAQLCAELVHPNIVNVHESGRDKEGLFLVLELVEGSELGVDLSSVMRARGAMPIAMAAFIAREILSGLAYAHERVDEEGRPRPVVHRDLSPHNVLVGAQGQVKVTDFGIARVIESADKTQTNVRGKPAYTSPERLLYEEVDARADVFSMGVVLHEMLTGERLFGGEGAKAAIRKILNDQVRSPLAVRADVPEVVADLCLDMLCRDPRRRPTARSALELIERSGLLEGGDQSRLAQWLQEEDLTRRVPGPVLEDLTANERPRVTERVPEEVLAMRSRTQSLSWAPPSGSSSGGVLPMVVAVLGVLVLGLVIALLMKAPRGGSSPAVARPSSMPPVFDAGVRRDAGRAVAVQVEAEVRDGGADRRDGGEAKKPRPSRRVTTVKTARKPKPSKVEVKSPATAPQRDGGATPLDRLFPEGYELPPKPDAGEGPALDPDALFPEGYDPGR